MRISCCYSHVLISWLTTHHFNGNNIQIYSSVVKIFMSSKILNTLTGVTAIAETYVGTGLQMQMIFVPHKNTRLVLQLQRP